LSRVRSDFRAAGVKLALDLLKQVRLDDRRNRRDDLFIGFRSPVRDDIRLKVDNSVNFHSFRHGIADAFRRAGYLDEQFGMLLGHSEATTTGTYGIMPQGILSDRVKLIEAVRFPTVQR
jgi:integrase